MVPRLSVPRFSVPPTGARRDVVVLGSTGSIGTQALDVIARNPDRFRVTAIAAGGANPALLAQQALAFQVSQVAVADPQRAGEVQMELAARIPVGHRPEVLIGPAAASQVAQSRCDVVLNGLTGAVGLGPTLAALTAGNLLALANKESLIIGGALVKRAAAPGQIVPVDSEHSAIAQALLAGRADEVQRLVLTASGGPFRGRTRDQLGEVTLAQALDHPTWAMGPVVTINSATLVNKGLEVIEAHLLFDVPLDRIVVMVHPQSVIHSLVEFTDGSTVAQLSPPDMRLPIAWGMAWPERVPGAAPSIDWSAAHRWTLDPLDDEAFPAVSLARAAGSAGGTAPAVYNATNEVAVTAFQSGRVSFLDIVDIVADVLAEHLGDAAAPSGAAAHVTSADLTADAVQAADAWARERAAAAVSDRSQAHEQRTIEGDRSSPAVGSGPQPSPTSGKERLLELAGLAPPAGQHESVTSQPAEGAAIPDPQPTPEAGTGDATDEEGGELMGTVLFVVGVLLAAVGIGASIALHEIGHLVPAKRFGIRVPQYMVGFGPTLWSRHRGETEYGIKWIPLGGYIRMIGMYPPPEGAPEGFVSAATTGRFSSLAEAARSQAWEEIRPGDESRMFYRLPVRRKVVIMLGGPTMNLVISAVLFTVLLVGIGIPTATTQLAQVAPCIPPAVATQQAAEHALATPGSVATTCSSADPRSPAAVAGLAAGETIVAVNGTPVTSWNQVTAVTRKSPGQTVALTVTDPGGAQREVSVAVATAYRPVYDSDNLPTGAVEEVGYLGVVPMTPYVAQPLTAVPEQMWNLTVRSAVAVVSLPVRVVQLAQDMVTGQARDPRSPVSVVGVGRLSGEVAAAQEPIKSKAAMLLSLMASLNLFLFLFNLIPLLPMDGGHVAGALWEGLRRRLARRRGQPDPGPVDVSRALPVAYAVGITLIALSSVVILADLIKPISLYG